MLPASTASEFPPVEPGDEEVYTIDLGMDLPDHVDDRAKAVALLDVMEHTKRFTRAVVTARPMESFKARPLVLAAIAIPCLLLWLYASIARPDWVYGPDPATMSAERRDANLRFAMYLVAEDLYSYRDTRGGLPQSLAEIGEDWPTITYSADGQTFVLQAADGSVRPMTFSSDQNLREFVGSSATYLRRRQQ